ncbi:hypothetical protein EEZ25_21875 [Micromonospora aurantiaca]|nr:hypothetical protein EEZ25_21875 [Micromonospora aurantiaca]
MAAALTSSALACVGSRFFPVGKPIDTCMLPILDGPVVAYAVAGSVAAGASEPVVESGVMVGVRPVRGR